MDPDTETWKDAIEALDPERRARDVVDVYRRDINRSRHHTWHWDQPTALALIDRDRDAIVARCADILRHAHFLHGAARCTRSKPFRICTVRADAVELYAMPLKPTQAQAIGNLHLGTVPDDRWVWVSLQLDWEIDDVIRIWTGSGAESSMWEEVVHPASGFAVLHAERIEGVLRRGWPDPWLHSLSGTLAANLRCCAVVYSTTLHEKVSVTRPRVDQYPLVSKEYYRIFSERPDLVELVLAFPGLLVVPDALRMGKLGDTAVDDPVAAVELLRPHLPVWAQTLEPPRLCHYARTMPPASLIVGGWPDQADETTGVRVDYTGHVQIWNWRFDALAAHQRVAGVDIDALPSAPWEWRRTVPEPEPVPAPDPADTKLSPEDHDRIFRKAILPDYGLG